jgi:hypothetical protein
MAATPSRSRSKRRRGPRLASIHNRPIEEAPRSHEAAPAEHTPPRAPAPKPHDAKEPMRE